MKFSWMRLGLAATGAGLLAAGAAWLSAGKDVRASDHADTAENYNRPGVDLTDLFAFPSPTNPDNFVLVMDTHGLLPAGQGLTTGFDPRVLYQFKFDVTGDAIEDYVLQVKFDGTGASQTVKVAGPMKTLTPNSTISYFGRRLPKVGTLNATFQPTPGMSVYAGGLEDPFFLDLERFLQIFPDRGTPLTGMQIDTPNPDTPRLGSFRGFPAGNTFGGDTSPAMDLLNSFNVLAIVIELPRASLKKPDGTLGVVNAWMTTSIFTGSPNYAYTQQDRLARPLINEVLATVTARRHEINNKDRPTDDPSQLKNDIEMFLTLPGGAVNRSRATKDVIEAVLVPDMMKFDLSKSGPGGYLGVETAMAFGGRLLTDDVVDLSLGIIFGKTVSALGLAPDDGVYLPTFVTDNVGTEGKHFRTSFPFLGPPR